MKKIVLIGDSIRIGYDSHVKKAYEGRAQVYYPAENCGMSTLVLLRLDDWKMQMDCGDDVDCVHWNAGLWDCLTKFNDGCLIPIEFYAENVDRICRRIRNLFPKSKIIFATITPVDETQFTHPDIYVRRNKDIEAYNEVAINIAKQYGCEINDLYGLMKNAPLSYHSDGTHYYTEEATRMITDKVLESIGACIGVEAPFCEESLKESREQS